MDRRHVAFLTLLTFPTSLAAAPRLAAQDAPAADQEIPVFGVEAAVVLVDVIVRDKKGRLVRDLTAGDFEVYEDGQKQTITDFQVIDRRPAPASAPPAPAGETRTAASTAGEGTPPEAAPAPPAEVPGSPTTAEPAVIAFIFDRMSPQARDTARTAARAYASRGHVDGDVVGVFMLDQTLHTLQPFTTELDSVTAAFDRAAIQGQTSYADVRDEARQFGDEAARGETTLALMGAQASGDPGTQAQAASVAVERTFDLIRTRMLQSFDRLERDQQGFASTNGLMAVVNGLKALPGRKTVVFFSEGLTISSNVLAQFQSVIATANRANVAVYAIDAGGLRVESGTQEARDELVATANRRLAMEGRGGVDGSEGALTAGLERAEDMLRLNPHTGLGQLAEETGGFLVADTNDASAGFRRIQEEMRFYYLLSYVPGNPNYDGRFRSISVKVGRGGTDVFTRNGYLAVPPDTVVPVRTYEGPAIAQLDLKDRPHDFPLRAAALSFPEAQRPGRVPVMVELPGSVLEYRLNEDKKVYEADFSIVARLRDDQGREVDRLSRRYPLTVPADRLDAARAGNILFFQETDLVPGRYTLEAVAYDAVADKASVLTSSIDVREAPPAGPRLSSVMILERVEKLTPAEVGGDNPLYYGETIVYPRLDATVSKSTMPALGFYFTAYGDPSGTAPGQARLDLLKSGRLLAQMPISLAAADARGRVQHAGTLPLDQLPAGDYTLKVTVGSGAAAQTREARFAVAE